MSSNNPHTQAVSIFTAQVEDPKMDAPDFYLMKGIGSAESSRPGQYSHMKEDGSLSMFRLKPTLSNQNQDQHDRFCLVHGGLETGEEENGEDGSALVWRDVDVSLLTLEDQHGVPKVLDAVTHHQAPVALGTSKSEVDSAKTGSGLASGSLKVWLNDESSAADPVVDGHYIERCTGYRADYIPIPDELLAATDRKLDVNAHTDVLGRSHFSVMPLWSNEFGCAQFAGMINTRPRDSHIGIPVDEWTPATWDGTSVDRSFTGTSGPSNPFRFRPKVGLSFFLADNIFDLPDELYYQDQGYYIRHPDLAAPRSLGSVRTHMRKVSDAWGFRLKVPETKERTDSRDCYLTVESLRPPTISRTKKNRPKRVWEDASVDILSLPNESHAIADTRKLSNNKVIQTGHDEHPEAWLKRLNQARWATDRPAPEDHAGLLTIRDTETNEIKLQAEYICADEVYQAKTIPRSVFRSNDGKRYRHEPTDPITAVRLLGSEGVNLYCGLVNLDGEISDSPSASDTDPDSEPLPKFEQLSH